MRSLSNEGVPGISSRRASCSTLDLTASTSAEGDGVGKEAQQNPTDVAIWSDEGSASSSSSSSSSEVKNGLGVLAATAATGGLLGWSAVHSLDLDLDLLGAVAGCLLALGLLAQEGPAGKLTALVGEFALGAIQVVGMVLKSTDVPARVAGTVGEELLEFVEVTSGAVAKGYLDSLPPVDERLKKEIEESKKTAEGLKERLDKANAALSEAKVQLAQRAANQRIVDDAKATAGELAESKKALIEKDVEISKSLELAGAERDALGKDLKAAKAETSRFRKMLESKSEMDDNIKALAEASEILEGRVREYEGRLTALTRENDYLRKDYGAEIERMEAERVATRDRVSNLEASLSRAEFRADEQREALERELALMAGELDRRSEELAAATATTDGLRGAIDSIKAKAEAQEAAQKAFVAAAEMQRREQEEEERAVAEENARALENDTEDREEATARALQKSEIVKEKDEKKAERGVMQKNRGVRAPTREKNAREQARPRAARTKSKAASPAASESEQPRKPAPAARAGTEMPQVATAGTGSGTAARGSRAENTLPKSKSGLMKLTVKNLREHCKEAGVPTTGTKADLVKRLLESLGVDMIR